MTRSMACQEAAPAGVDQRFVALYAELKRIARSQRRRSGMDTLNTTALVHDLYLQMAQRNDMNFREEVSFYAYAAKAMRHLLIDRARARARIKAGGDQVQIQIDAREQDDWSLDAFLADPQLAFELDSALAALTREDARAAEVVELYLFGGLTITRIAELWDVSSRTVDRDWRFARAFLLGAMTP